MSAQTSTSAHNGVSPERVLGGDIDRQEYLVEMFTPLAGGFIEMTPDLEEYTGSVKEHAYQQTLDILIGLVEPSWVAPQVQEDFRLRYEYRLKDYKVELKNDSQYQELGLLTAAELSIKAAFQLALALHKGNSAEAMRIMRDNLNIEPFLSAEEVEQKPVMTREMLQDVLELAFGTQMKAVITRFNRFLQNS